MIRGLVRTEIGRCDMMLYYDKKLLKEYGYVIKV